LQLKKYSCALCKFNIRNRHLLNLHNESSAHLGKAADLTGLTKKNTVAPSAMLHLQERTDSTNTSRLEDIVLPLRALSSTETYFMALPGSSAGPFGTSWNGHIRISVHSLDGWFDS